MSQYIFFGDISDWSMSHPEVQARLAEIFGHDWKRHWEPAFAGNDGIWFDPKA